MQRDGRNDVLPGLVTASDASHDDAGLARLAQHLMLATEEEKAALAAQLHTDIGGALSAIALDLAWALKRIEPVVPEAAERLRQAIALVQDASTLKRRIVDELRPTLLEHLGLVPALTDAVRRWTARTGLPVAARLPESTPGLDHGPALALFRVAQEALANVERHAGAQHVTLSVMQDDGDVTLVVEDDGVGLAPDALARATCHGIAAMVQRLAAFGGTLRVGAGEGARGTRLVARMPAAGGADVAHDRVTPSA